MINTAGINDLAAGESIAFYRGHGFKQTGRETGEDGCERVSFEMRLKKSIQGC